MCSGGGGGGIVAESHPAAQVRAGKEMLGGVAKTQLPRLGPRQSFLLVPSQTGARQRMQFTHPFQHSESNHNPAQDDVNDAHPWDAKVGKCAQSGLPPFDHQDETICNNHSHNYTQRTTHAGSHCITYAYPMPTNRRCRMAFRE